MKTFRLFFTSLLGSLFISQMPSPAACQMVAGASMAVCHMPCCKSIPMPSCPHMRAATAPQDRIAASPVVPMVLQVVHHWMVSLATHSLKPSRLFDHLTQSLKSLVFASPVVGRSPPPDSALQAA